MTDSVNPRRTELGAALGLAVGLGWGLYWIAVGSSTKAASTILALSFVVALAWVAFESGFGGGYQTSTGGEADGD